jgi:hypothetical protein
MSHMLTTMKLHGHEFTCELWYIGMCCAEGGNLFLAAAKNLLANGGIQVSLQKTAYLHLPCDGTSHGFSEHCPY